MTYKRHIQSKRDGESWSLCGADLRFAKNGDHLPSSPYERNPQLDATCLKCLRSFEKEKEKLARDCLWQAKSASDRAHALRLKRAGK